MFNFIFVYVVFNNGGQLSGIFKNKANAINSIPESQKHFPKEITRGKWSYGTEKPDQWTVLEVRVQDSNDLTPPQH